MDVDVVVEVLSGSRGVVVVVVLELVVVVLVPIFLVEKLVVVYGWCVVM